MQLILFNDLPFVTITIAHRQQQIDIPYVLVDTGSASTIVSSDWGLQIGIEPEPDDIILTVRGVGGSEAVFSREVDFLKVEDTVISCFPVEFGEMNYGFEINGILGMDFLVRTGAIIDLGKTSLYVSPSKT